jgi:xylono-1,5-lactonase
VLGCRATPTDVAAVLPATPLHIHRPTVIGEVASVWTAQALQGAAPLWSVREAALYWADSAGHQLHRFQPSRRLRDSWSLGGRVSAIAERTNHPGLLIALQRELVFFDPDTGRLQGQHRAEPGHNDNQFGAGVCDARGRLWFGTASATGRTTAGALYRYSGGSRCVRVLEGLTASPGLTLSQDQRTLYVSDPVQGQVHAHAIHPELGTLGPSRCWLTLGLDDGSPHGMCTDAKGRIWLAHSGAGCVSCHHPQSAEELLRIAVPASQVTGCAFGGDGLQTLFITTASTRTVAAPFGEPLAGALFAVEVNSPGLPAPLFVG